MSLSEIILAGANNFAHKLLSGDIPVGHNGPYNDPESLVRVLAHWSIVFMKAQEITGLTKYGDYAKACLKRLQSAEFRPDGFTHICRYSSNKTRCNGLVGPAWVMEAFNWAEEKIDSKEYLEHVVGLYKLHTFSRRLGLWRIRDCDGKDAGLDFTANHQLWFAAQAAALQGMGFSQAGIDIDRFMDRLSWTLRVYNSGMIKHPVWGNLLLPAVIGKRALREKRVNIRFYIRRQMEKEAGYHAFNLYALAELERHTASHDFWRGKRFRRIVSFAVSRSHRDEALSSEYGSRFNPCGIELAYFLNRCSKYITHNVSNLAEEVLAEHFSLHLNTGNLLMTRNSADPVISAARIYEACRLPDYTLRLTLCE